MIRDTHDIKTQVQIKGPDGTTYPFPLTSREFTAFPLSRGNGRYEVSILELISDNNYAVGLSAGFDVNLTNEFGPYLYPSQYVRYTDHSDSVILARKLSSQSDSDLSYVKNVYKYITGHIKYDEAKAASIQPNYIPDADATLASGKGICFDYAVLMTAMLRSQNIPARLEVGYVGQVYHAWISVYLKEKGWIDDTISFDGQSWTLMDPTLAANNSTASIRKFTGDGSKYTVRYLY
jgi:transglutaminase-like putative cysteine protease